jgi:hypothetical protein
MATIVRTNVGSATTYTLTGALATGTFVNAGRLNVGTGGPLLVDLTIPVTGMTAPVAGALQAVIVPRDAAGNAGGTATATLLWPAYTFNPAPVASNAATAFTFSCLSVPLPADCDVWLYNNALGQNIPSGSVLNMQAWSPGT